MGLLPTDFYRMLYADFLIRERGYRDKVNEDRRVFRLGIKRLLEPYLEKGKRISEFDVFGIDGDEELKEEIKRMRSMSASTSLDRLKAMKRLEAWKKKEHGQNNKLN